MKHPTAFILLLSFTLLLTQSQASFSFPQIISRLRGHFAHTEQSNSNGDQNIRGYDEEYRGQYHYSSQENWMGYPSGFLKIDDLYHMYMQVSPNSTESNQLSWGHATSKDLIYWDEQPLAIEYDNLTGGDQIWTLSGSTVYDSKNTSGFGISEPPVVSIYTAQGIYQNSSLDEEQQAIQYSDKQGLYFVEYEKNPVLSKGSNSFRDPHVSWDDTRNQWVMVVAESQNTSIDIYTSTNLKNWTYQSTFGPQGFHESCQWEGPQLMRLAIENSKGVYNYILSVSVLEGTTDYYNMFVQYFVVNFNGTHLINQNTPDLIKKADYGTDFYQPKSMGDYTKKNHEVWIGWLNNLNYASSIPTKNWRGQMTLPREISLRSNQTSGTFDLVQKPVSSAEKLREGLIPMTSNQVTGFENYGAIFEYHADSFELKVKFRYISGDVLGVRIYYGTDVGTPQETLIGYDRKNKLVFINRQLSGYTELNRFTNVMEAFYAIEGEEIEFDIFVDRSSVEVFVDGGIRVLTAQIFPDSTKNGITGFSPDGLFVTTYLRLWKLKSIWGNKK